MITTWGGGTIRDISPNVIICVIKNNIVVYFLID